MKRNIQTLLLPLLLLCALPAHAQQPSRPNPSDAAEINNVAASTTAGLGALAVSSNTVTPYYTVSHVGGGHIRTITVPDAKRGQTACFIPDAPFTWSPSASKWFSSF